MNRRQKLVQQQFLNNEAELVKRLEKVYDQALTDINDKIRNLNFTINNLKLEYSWLDDGDPEKARIKSMIQSKIYQRDYQEQLQKQVDGILKRIDVAEIDNIKDYLDTCYSDAFIGNMFDAHGQGIPLLMPIDQEAMVRAVQLESKISKGLYTRLGEDVKLLKKRITSEVSRGISTGMTYAQVATQLKNQTRIGYNKAIRIARTEGHRIQTTATMDAMKSAKDIGADVVKQWDATLDARTRSSHAKVDGEIREIDKPFSNGLMFPGDPNGRPEEVINCRCALLQRARWALDDEELQELKDRANYYGLDKTDEFDDFKKKYLKATQPSSGGLAAKVSGIGVPEHEEPLLLKTIDFTDKKAVIETLTEFEKNAIMDDVETACVITKSGKVYKCFGVKDRVFPDFDLKDELIGSVVSHNHPINETIFSFSDDDFDMFQKYNIELLRGCDEKYTYELTRNATLIDDSPNKLDDFELWQHARMISIAEANGFGYRRWLNG